MKITDEKKINFRKKVSEKLLTKKACSGTIYEQCESIELYSSIAQPVEHAAVNRRVVGSSPTGGAIKERTFVYQDKVRIFYAFRAKMGIFKQNKRKIGLRDGQTAVPEPVFCLHQAKK